MSAPVYQLSLGLVFLAGCGLGAVERRIVIKVVNDEAVHLMKSTGGEDCRNGVLHLDNGDYQSALESFQKATRNEPAEWEGYFGLGLAYEALECFDKARAAYRNANLHTRSEQECIKQALKRVDFVLEKRSAAVG